MSFIAAAAIGAGGSLVGGLLQSGAQSNAGAIDKNTFKHISKQEKPFITAGQNATSSLQQLLGLTPATGQGGNAYGTGLPGGYLNQTFNPTQDQLNNYPGFQFALKTGGQAIRNADTPGLGALSGPALKDLIGFNQNLANTYYGNYFNQFQTQQNNIFSRLAQLAGLGQNAAGNLGNQGTQLGLGQGQAVAAAGGSLGAGLSGAANSFLLPSILGSLGGGGGFDTGTGAGVGLGFGG